MNHLDINVDIMKSYNKMRFERNRKIAFDAINMKNRIIQNKLLEQRRLLEERNKLEIGKQEILEENIQNHKTPIAASTKYNILKKGQVLTK